MSPWAVQQASAAERAALQQQQVAPRQAGAQVEAVWRPAWGVQAQMAPRQHPLGALQLLRLQATAAGVVVMGLLLLRAATAAAARQAAARLLLVVAVVARLLGSGTQAVHVPRCCRWPQGAADADK